MIQSFKLKPSLLVKIPPDQTVMQRTFKSQMEISLSKTSLVILSDSSTSFFEHLLVSIPCLCKWPSYLLPSITVLFSFLNNNISSIQFSRSVVSDSLRPHEPAARQASLSITNSRSPPKPMSMESVIILAVILLLLFLQGRK